MTSIYTSIPTVKELREVVEVEADRLPCEAKRKGMLGRNQDHVALCRQPDHDSISESGPWRTVL
jgi:hypothetical protein